MTTPPSTVDQSTDIIVVGAGTAGLMLAIAAADGGARVTLFEKTDRIGGTLHISSGMFSAAGTKRQRSINVEDTPDEHFADIIRISRDTVNRALVRQYVDAAPAFVDWLTDTGFEFEPNCPVIIYGHEPYSKARTYWGVENGRSLLKLFTRLLEPHVQSGAVTIRLTTPVDALLVEHGRVVGVEAMGVAYRADAVVLTTGGYSSSPELFARFTGGRRLVSVGNPASTGDGIRMAEAIGGSVTGDQYFLPTFGGLEDPDRPGRVWLNAPDTWDVNAVLVPQTRPPWEVWVNANGDRFLAEDNDSVDARERVLKEQPDMRFFVVFDEGTLRVAPPLVRGWTADDLRRLAAEGRFLHVAPTLHELAPKIGVLADNLVAAVERYNTALERGEPDPFGRQHRPRPLTDGPFYALRQQGIVLRTWAGLQVDSEFRVTRQDGSPIEGLYAVGETVGAATFSGDSFCGGMSIGPALVFGQQVGRTLSRQLAASRSETATPLSNPH